MERVEFYIICLLVTDMSHEEGNVSLYIYGEFLHGGEELGSVGNLYGAVNLEVQEVGADEDMVLISNRSTSVESAYAVMSGGVCMTA